MKRFDINSRFTSLKQATLINAFSKYSVVILSLVFSAVLARILTPEDYGVLAVVTVFTNFFVLFSDMGIGTAVIQNKELTEDDTNRIFSFSLILGVGLGLVFSLMSVVLVRLYKNTVYYIIGPMLGVGLMLSTFNMVPNAQLMKHKLFMTAAIRTILTCVIGYIVAIVIARRGGKYYAIVFQQLLSSLFVFLWNLLTTRLKLNFTRIGESMNKIRRFSTFQFGFNLINYFSRNLDNMLTGYYFGEAPLGYYDKSYRLMRYPVDNLTSVITPAMQPILSDHQNDIEYVYQKYKAVVKLLGVLAVYISIVCFFASREIILLYFGNQWEGSVISFHYLSISLFFQITGGVSGSIYQSVNKTKEMFISGLVGSVITVIGIVVGILTGSIDGLALSYSIAFILNFIKSQWFLAHYCFNDSFWNLIMLFRNEYLIAAALVLAMVFIPSFESLWISLIIKAGVAGILYLILLWITKEYKALSPMMPARLRKLLKIE